MDLANEAWIDLVDDLIDLCDVEPDKVSAKNRPTFVCKLGNRLQKMSLHSEIDKVNLKPNFHGKIMQ